MMQVDDKVTEKEKRTYAAAATVPTIFIISTVTSLVRSCQFLAQTQDSGSKQQCGPHFNGLIYNKQNGHKLDKDEVDLLINNITHKLWWKGTGSDFRMLRNQVAAMWAHIAYDNI